jgi:hypothetical protein
LVKIISRGKWKGIREDHGEPQSHAYAVAAGAEPHTKGTQPFGCCDFGPSKVGWGSFRTGTGFQAENTSEALYRRTEEDIRSPEGALGQDEKTEGGSLAQHELPQRPRCFTQASFRRMQQTKGK